MSRNIISPSKEEEGKLLQYFNTGDYKNAEILAQEITNKYPNHPFGWRILSIILAMIGKFENSLIASQKLIEIAPEIPSSYINMGGSYQALRKFQDSEKYYRHAIYLDNRNLSANLNLGIVLFKLNRKEESEEVLKKVLLIDFDPQANSSSSIGLEVSAETKTIYDLLSDSIELEECIHKSKLSFLDIIPSHIDLVGIEIEYVNVMEREYLLRKAIEKIKVDYDFIIIDCPPSLGLLTINALSASDSVIIPIQCEYLALEGLGKLLNTIKNIQKIHNKNLSIEGLLLTMYDTRLNLSNQVRKEVKIHFNEMVFKTVIYRNVKLGEATSFGKSIIDYDVSSRGANNYLNLAKELLLKF